MQSRAAVITGVGTELEIRTIPIPELEPGGILIRVDAATLCGTDVHRWQGHIPPNEYPFIPGHETCGTIVDMRGPVRTLLNEQLAVGDRIVASYSHCGHCYFCRVSRQTTLCNENTVYGAWRPERLMGGCAEYHTYPAGASFVKVPAEVPPALAASSACALRTMMHAYEQLGSIQSYDTIVLLGSGPLGLYGAAIARARGASQVLVIGAPSERLSVATALGADDVLDMTDVPGLADRIEWVEERTGGRGADAVFNCANSQAFLESLEMVRRGGRVINVGATGGPPLPFPPQRLFEGISINTIVMAEARHFYEAVKFLADKRSQFPFERMLSNTFALDHVTEALRKMAAFTEVKPVITPASI
jgi:L-iditol 2-dehydrogenase